MMSPVCQASVMLINGFVGKKCEAAIPLTVMRKVLFARPRKLEGGTAKECVRQGKLACDFWPMKCLVCLSPLKAAEHGEGIE